MPKPYYAISYTAFEDPFLRNFTMTPAEREEYDRKKNEERQRIEEKKVTRLETAQRIKK